MENRITELEKKSAFQEHMIEELNEALIAQQKKIDTIEAQLKQFKEQITNGDFIKQIEDEEPPPHY
ncbi:hypothetical protein MNBD_UNCLBAC01-432 [hydrothermal vent metagenome]|uniref:Protein SlyX homolog n=1 Tax=hydrothermal vent metagenome TaxID=652676 RepID=A0A3B1DND2_9ZZZZ